LHYVSHSAEGSEFGERVKCLEEEKLGVSFQQKEVTMSAEKRDEMDEFTDAFDQKLGLVDVDTERPVAGKISSYILIQLLNISQFVKVK